MIRNVLFDIGNVLLSFQREPTVREFAAHSRTVPAEEFGFEHVFIDGLWQEMEAGRVSPEQYYRRFLEVSGCRIDYRHFRLIWSKHFQTVPEMIALGRSLAAGYRIFLFSNTDPIHIPPLFDRFPSVLFFDGMALSWQLGALKPDPEFFRLGLEKFGLRPDECLYVDDQEDNVTSAAGLGIQGVVCDNPAAAATRMRSVLSRDGIAAL